MSSQASERRCHDVFISYSREDKATAEAVCAALEGSGIPCWIGPRDTQAGAYGRSIMEAIRSARMLVLILSEHADRTPNVLTEVAEAFDRKLPLLPFRLANFATSDAMRFYIRTQHWIDAFPEPAGQYLGKLVARVRERLAQSAAGDPASGELGGTRIEDSRAPEAGVDGSQKPPVVQTKPPGGAGSVSTGTTVSSTISPPVWKRGHVWPWLLVAALVSAAILVGVIVGVNPGAFDSRRVEPIRGERVDVPPRGNPNTADGANCRVGNCWGAVAYGAGDAWAYAVNYASRATASNAAQKRCGNRCTNVLTFHNSCGAYASGTSGYGWGTANDRSGAETNALVQCRTKTDACIVRVWGCTSR